ncbi:carbohydrate ABC transporter permease [Actinomyces sp. 186855]|nr:carbohydrate ABC transporter permease [Actinomyces sp. AC-20-1]MCL3788998.1 carbohydrate ABC transporter permease [Actinomyces sp. 187325]MCL3791353.1 carbohydrate ABC transporter permease [Actinomyces sp. 186855]MCL3793936.1 carbohydrate ABC transporter permease [Actinomyces sp. 217892]
MKKRRLIGDVVAYILLIVLVVYSVFPFLWMALSALKPRDEIRARVPSLTIDHPTLDNFRRVLFDHGFLTYIRNSLLVSAAACLLALVIAVFAGYVFSRFFRRRSVKYTNVFMLLSQMIPGVLLLVPLYITMRNLGILESHLSLILAYTTFVIPMCTFMLSSAYDSIPVSLEEAAEIDGCSRVQVMRRVVLPVMTPSIVSVGLYAFINAWNEFMFGYIFISTERLRTITPAIMLFKGANSIDWGGLMAASVLAVLPVALIFLFLQRFFMAGMMSGAVKG